MTTPRRILPSDPAYQAYHDLWNLYAIAVNPHVWMNEMDLADWELTDVRLELKQDMRTLLGEDQAVALFYGGLVLANNKFEEQLP